MRSATRGLGTGGQVVLGLGLALGVVTLIEAAGRGECGFGFGASWVTHDDGGYRVHVREAGCRFEARIRPPFSVDDAETAVTAVGAGGRIEIDDRGDTVRRRFEAEPGPDGPRIRYFRDGVETPLDDDGRAWLAVALPRALRASGADLEARVDRLFRRGGLEAVLAEAEETTDDEAARRLLTAARSRGLDPAGEAAVLAKAAWTIGSDAELADLLRDVADDLGEAGGDDAGARGEALFADPEFRAAFVDAAREIGSDAELRRALGTFLRDGRVGAPRAEAVLEAASEIGADSELADLVAELADVAEAPLPDEVADRLVEIGSDHELRRAILALLARRDLAGEAVGEWLRAATEIGADGDLSEVLIAAAAAWPADRALPDAYFEAAATVGSDFECARVLLAASERPSLAEEEIAALLGVAGAIGSDSELAGLLADLVDRRPEVAARADFAEVRRGIGSAHDRERVAVAAEAAD